MDLVDAGRKVVVQRGHLSADFSEPMKHRDNRGRMLGIVLDQPLAFFAKPLGPLEITGEMSVTSGRAKAFKFGLERPELRLGDIDRRCRAGERSVDLENLVNGG